MLVKVIVFSYFSLKQYVVTPHLNYLDETLQMRGHNICFYVVYKNYSYLSSNTLSYLELWYMYHVLLFSSPEHKVLKVSYYDHPVSGVRRQSSVVRRPSCVVNNSFKVHLLLNHWSNFKIISHKCSPEAPLPKLLKWFRSAEQNGRQS